MNNVTKADFLQKTLSQASGKGLDVNAALANLALTIIDIQKEHGGISKAIQMLSQSLGQLMEAHNRLAQHVEKTLGVKEAEAPAPPQLVS